MRARQPPKAPYNIQHDTDRLSNLPGHIVDKILSCLSIRDAVRTSILSSHWRYRWATLPNLIFDKDCCPYSSDDQLVARRKLVSIIDHVLILHFGVLLKFKLSHKDLQAVTDIDRWILRISRSSVEEFVLEIWKGQRYKIPSSLYLCKHLVHLELFNCLLSLPAGFKGFPNLKSLDLQHITMTEYAFENLITWCPLLERLTLMNFDGFSHIKICAPNLQFFDIGGDFGDVSLQNTKLLSIVSIALYGNATTELGTRQDNANNLLKFLFCIPHVQRLEVQSYFLKYLAVGNAPGRLRVVCPDLNCLSLRINFADIKENKAAYTIFQSSPNLVELEMLARPEKDSITETRTSFWGQINDIEFVFARLQVARIFDISGIGSELDFVMFLLANSPVLEKLTIKPASPDGGLELLKELLRYRRASTRAEVIYLDA